MSLTLHQLVVNLGWTGWWLLVLPTGFIAALTFINRDTKRYLANGLGINSELYLGWFGIFCHELSHLVVALLFGHHIASVRLLKRPHPDQLGADGRADLALGYVNHTWNQNSAYQRIGNLFIGIAPIFGCSLVLLALMAGLLPGLFQGILTLMTHPLALDWTGFRQALAHPTDRWWRWLIMLVIAINISVGGFDLSAADLSNSRLGLIGFILTLVLITVVVTWFNWANGWLRIVATIMVPFSVILTFSLLASLLTNLVVKICLQIKLH